jgi:hypothetical protein
MLETLAVIGSLCPHIKYVGMYVDACAATICELSALWDLDPIPSLQTLEVGISKLHIHGWHLGAGAFLAHICLNIGMIDTHVPWR